MNTITINGKEIPYTKLEPGYAEGYVPTDCSASAEVYDSLEKQVAHYANINISSFDEFCMELEKELGLNNDDKDPDEQ